eukprot:6189377-Pleurochrysis_carterae.AAC.5
MWWSLLSAAIDCGDSPVNENMPLCSIKWSQEGKVEGGGHASAFKLAWRVTRISATRDAIFAISRRQIALRWGVVRMALAMCAPRAGGAE